MESILEVTLWGRKVGVLAWQPETGTGIFEFYADFTLTGLDIAPLTMSREIVFGGERIFSFRELRGKTFKGLPGLLADSLPDHFGNTLIDEYFASKGYNSVVTTPVDRLCYIGSRAMGALEYHPAWDDKKLNVSAKIELSHLTALAQEVLNNRKKFQIRIKGEDIHVGNLLKIGTSAGGAKPKAIIAWNEDTGEVRSGQVKAPESFTYWILKFDGVEDKKIHDNPLGVGKIEYAYYRMAIDCGIRMTECRLLPDGHFAHFMTKRFDRRDDGSRLHTQTLCAIAHYDRDNRYSYEQVFQVMRRLHLPETDMDQMYRRMVFNVMARNNDDHTKNHAFLMDETGQWQLTTAYDLMFSYNPSGNWSREHQLSVNNKRDRIEYADLMAVAKSMGIRKADEIIEQIAEVISHWNEYSREADVRKEHSRQIQDALLLIRK